MKAKKSKLFEWRDFFMSEMGPSSSTMRHVLLVLSTFMDVNGKNAFPAERTIAAKCALSEKSVRTHLKTAEKLGWIERERRRPKGKQWFQYLYFATFPSCYGVPEGRSGNTPLPPESQAERPESHNQNYRKEVPTNSSVNSLNNSVSKENQKGENWQKFHELVQKMTKNNRTTH